MNTLYCITGASGVGKTSIVQELERRGRTNTSFLFFDSVGVPTYEEMLSRYGSTEAWQKQTTLTWMQKIQAEHLPLGDVVLEGSVRPSFVAEACAQVGLNDYRIVLIDCDFEEMARRLVERGQAFLANEDMKNWARFLRDECGRLGQPVIDTTLLTVAQAAGAVELAMGNQLTRS